MPRIQPKKQTQLLKGSLKNLFFPPEKDEYEYFARAREIPFVSGNDLSKAAWAADAAMLSYARHGSVRMDDQELNRCLGAGGLKLQGKIGEDPTNWNSPGTQAIFARGNGFAILAFRGTEPDDPQDLCDDLDLVLAPEPDYKSSAAPASGLFSTILNEVADPCIVHRGFQNALNRVWDQVYGYLSGFREKNPSAEICLAGHSLGGALALLTYSRFHDANVSAYTFGCPRVGNTAFARRVADGGKGHFRCVNFNDMVAHIPLESALYLHAPANCHRFDDSGCLDLDHEGTLAVDLSVVGSLAGGLPADLMADSHKLDELPAPPGLVDHSPARYCVRLWNCV